MTGSAENDRISFGESSDITGGAGEDVFLIGLISVSNSSVPRFSTITDLSASEDDSIDFGGILLLTATTGTAVNLIAEADLGLAPDAAATFANYLNLASNQTAGVLSGFEFAGNTYIVEDNNSAAATFASATDCMVELTGSVDLTEITYA